MSPLLARAGAAARRGTQTITIWSATHEDGTGGGARASGGGTTTLKEWYSPEVGATGSYGGGEFNDTGGTSDRSTTVAHSGTGSAKLTGVADGNQGIRLFRWAEGNTYRELFYQAWYYLPAKFALNGPDTYCIIFEFKSRNTAGTQNDPFWYITISPQAGLAQRLTLWWGAQSGLAGPQSGDPAATFKTYSSTVDVPTATWFKLRAFVKASKDFDGHIKVWYQASDASPEVLLWDVDNVRTGHPNTNFNAWQTRPEWAPTLYSDGTSPGSPVLYVDDARIDREQAGGGGSFATIARSGSPQTVRNSTSTTSHTAAAPTGAVTGDTVYRGIVLGLGSGGGTLDVTMTAPSGWTLVAGPVHAGTGARNLRAYMFRRRLTGGADDTFNGVSSVSCESIQHAQAYTNVDATTPEDVTASTMYEGLSTGSSYPIGSVTTVTNGAWLVGFWSLLTGSGTITAPGTMTQQATDVYSGGYRTLLADEGPVTAGATGSRAATGNGDREWAGALVALRPAAV